MYRSMPTTGRIYLEVELEPRNAAGEPNRMPCYCEVFGFPQLGDTP